MRMRSRTKMTLAQKVKLVLIIVVFAAIAVGFFTLINYTSGKSTTITENQSDMGITEGEAKSRQLAVRCIIQSTDATRLYGQAVQYEVTIYNNTNKPVRNWTIETKIDNVGRVDNIWNARCYKKDDKVVIIPPEDIDIIPAGHEFTFGMAIVNAAGSRIPSMVDVKLTAETRVGTTELAAFWILLICLFIWVVCGVSYIIGVYAYRKRMRQHEMDSEVIFQTIYTFTSFIDAKDPYTRGHSVRVGLYAREIAKEMKLPENDVNNVYYAGLLHDAGKISVPDAVLNKPGKLNDAEFELIKSHTMNGARMLRRYTAIEGIKEVALYHHERYDGKGYPTGKSGKDIPLYARIVCVADSYDAMSSNRVYRKELPREKIIEELEKNSGTQFDPDIVPYMVHMIRSDIADELRRNADGLVF